MINTHIEVFMKYIILLAFLVGCSETTAPVTQTPTVSAPVVAEPIKVERLPLAWGSKSPAWDKAIYDELATLPDVELPTLPCKTLKTKDCAAQLLSIIAKRESNFDPSVKYNETGHLSGVVSRGLLQISKDSANGYGCNITDEKQLHDPVINLKCGVKILSKWAKTDKTLIDQPKLGCARYWSTCRSKDGTSKSYKEIMTYLSKL